MTDIPTALDNKPSNLRDIRFTISFTQRQIDEMESGKDIEIGLPDEAVAAITGLLPKKITQEHDGRPYSFTYNSGWNDYADTTLRNFSGQTEGNHGDSDSPVESA